MATADVSRLVTSMDKIANLAVGAADRIAMRPLDLPTVQGQHRETGPDRHTGNGPPLRRCTALSRDLRDAFALSSRSPNSRAKPTPSSRNPT